MRFRNVINAWLLVCSYFKNLKKIRHLENLLLVHGHDHFVWNNTMKEFYNPSYNKAILYETLIILPDSYWYSSKQGIFDIFSFRQNKIK